MAHSKSASLPKKPRHDFPLYVHRSDRWAKKVRGKLHYFGKATADPKGVAALELWLDQRDELLAGRTPHRQSHGLKVADLCSDYLAFKRRLLVNEEISPRTFDDAKATTDLLVSAFGKNRLVVDLGPTDFSKLREVLAKRLGVVALGNAVQRVRSVFRFGKAEGLKECDVVFGSEFRAPSKKTMRLSRAAKGPRLFQATELRKLIAAADVQMKAMIYLAINGGLGNSDVANVPIKALDLKGGWLNFPRPKTGIDRRIPLWPETVAAVKAAISKRPTPKDKADENLVFITKYGHAWAKLGRYNIEDTAPPTVSEQPKRKRISANNSLSKEFGKLAADAGVSRTFYDLRHSFATMGGESKDQVALSAIMGHADESMAAAYRERISDKRLQDVVYCVRSWLIPAKKKPDQKAPKKTRAGIRVSHDNGHQLRVVG